MGRLAPISPSNLIRRLLAFGWEGPRQGGKHRYMQNGSERVYIPNEHGAVISVGTMRGILRDAGISVEEWNG